LSCWKGEEPGSSRSFRVDLADADELAEHGAEVDLASAEADASAAAAGRWPTKLKTFRVKRNAADWARRVEDEMVRGCL
jgi:hypothetical protein